MACLSDMANIVAANGLAIPGVEASTAMILKQLSLDIPFGRYDKGLNV